MQAYMYSMYMYVRVLYFSQNKIDLDKSNINIHDKKVTLSGKICLRAL